MIIADVNSFKEERSCLYKERQYLVRDNGAVLRLPKSGGRTSKCDNKWTFGTFDPNSGYMLIGQERVHRIVCTAFHGEPVGDKNIVDHKDTNRSNNRPENLHWVTKMENILNNPITMAKVEIVCGSREAFIEDPSLLFGHESMNPNFLWMRAVSPEEAKAAYERWKEWSQKPKEERLSVGDGSGPGEWIYDIKQYNPANPLPGFRAWKCKVEDRTEESSFPLAPPWTVEKEDVIQKYRDALVPGATFLISRYYSTIVTDVEFFAEEKKLRVLTERVNAQRIVWYVFEIWAEGQYLVHKSVGNYGKNKRKDAEDALRDLTKFYRQEWRYKQNKPTVEYLPKEEVKFPILPIPENSPKEIKDYAPAENIEQRNWSTPTEFPMCPSGMPEKPLEAYLQRMIEGDVFCRNRFGESILVDVGWVPEEDALIVLTNQPGGIKEWYMSGIYIENGHYIHESIGSFFDEEDARTEFALQLGESVEAPVV